MESPSSPLILDRAQILGFRRVAGGLVARAPMSPGALRTVAWAGLQDSMPRAALLSIHARVAPTAPDVLDDPALVQLWGPRYSAYAVAAEDRAVFTLGRMPLSARGRRRAHEMASRLRAHLGERRASHHELATTAGLDNRLRYATTTGTVLIRWDGARSPIVWSVPAPEVDPARARAELARRHLQRFGPTTPAHLATWAGVSAQEAEATYRDLHPELIAVRTPIGPAWLLAADEAAARAGTQAPPGEVRLLPSGDAHFLSQGRERELLVADPRRRAQLWTSRVWPGAVLVEGELRGIWRRRTHTLSVQPWGRLTAAHRAAIEAEAAALPLPGLTREVAVAWV